MPNDNSWKKRIYWMGDETIIYPIAKDPLRRTSHDIFALRLRKAGLSFIREIKVAGKYRVDFLIPITAYKHVIIEYDGPEHDPVKDRLRDKKIRSHYKYGDIFSEREVGLFKVWIVRVKHGEEAAFFANKFEIVKRAQKKHNFPVNWYERA